MSQLPLTDVVDLNALPVFRAGDYPQGTFDRNFIEHLADAYDPAFHEAPNYLDHDDPSGVRPAGGLAFGWIKRLYVKGDTLYADLTSVPKIFADLLQAGRVKKRSIELYPDLDGKGPYLRALAWPMIPQVKALADVHPTQFFSDQDSPFLSIPYSQKETPMPENESTEKNTFVTRDELQLMLESLKTDLLAEQRKLQSQAQVQTFCEQMVIAGKMTPAERATEEPLLIAQVRRELSENFHENPNALSTQRMNFYRARSRSLLFNGDDPTDPPGGPDQQNVVRTFRENQSFFHRLGVSLDDLLHADNVERRQINPLV